MAGIFKAYDIRGVYPQDLNETVVADIARAAFTFFVRRLHLKHPPRIVLGYDGRISSPTLAASARTALVAAGAEILDIGLAATPTMYFAVLHLGADAGVQITASHNTKEWNGVKMVVRENGGLTKIGQTTGIHEIERMVLQQDFVFMNVGRVEEIPDVRTDQVARALEVCGGPAIAPFKIVADPGNAVGALSLEALLAKLPGELVKMNFAIDGTFPAHQPDPLQFATLADLREAVVREGAALGLAPDGDGDRLFFIDERGEVVPASLVSSLVASELLRTHPGEKIMVDVRNTLNVSAAVTAANGTTVLSRVGHALITDKMREEHALFAGENSGHFFFRDTGFAEDPMPVIMLVLAVMTREGKSLSEILAPFAVCVESGEFNFRTERASEILSALNEKYREGEVSLLDGLSINYPDWRFNVRLSNTEPLLRLNVEAANQTTMEEKRDEIVQLIQRM